MSQNREFIGRPYGEGERESMDKALQNWSEESSKLLEGELEKSPEEIRMIETINSIIQSELESLGIEGYRGIPLERVHILSEDAFKKNFPDSEDRAFFSAVDDAVYLNKRSTNTAADIFSTLLHELIHRASTVKFYAAHDGGISDARVGYRVHSSWKKPERQNRLRGFNEVMNDYTVYKILLKNQDLLKDSFGITKEDIEGPIYAYMHYGPILESVVKKVSADNGLTAQEVFDDLERGQFQKNILILKHIERSFGNGSLEILALLQTLKTEEDNDQLRQMIETFFAEEDGVVRQGIRSEILAFFKKSEKSFAGWD